MLITRQPRIIRLWDEAREVIKRICEIYLGRYLIKIFKEYNGLIKLTSMKRKTVAIIFFILTIVFVVVAVFTVLKLRFEETKSERARTEANVSSIIYRNEKYGFEFMYPGSWLFNDQMNSPRPFIEIWNKNVDANVANIYIYPSWIFGVSLSAITGNAESSFFSSGDEIVKNKIYGEPVVFKYGNWQGFREQASEEPGLNWDAIHGKLASRGSTIEALWVGNNLTSISAEKYFLPILSSFRFIEPDVSKAKYDEPRATKCLQEITTADPGLEFEPGIVTLGFEPSPASSAENIIKSYGLTTKDTIDFETFGHFAYVRVPVGQEYLWICRFRQNSTIKSAEVIPSPINPWTHYRVSSILGIWQNPFLSPRMTA